MPKIVIRSTAKKSNQYMLNNFNTIYYKKQTKTYVLATTALCNAIFIVIPYNSLISYFEEFRKN